MATFQFDVNASNALIQMINSLGRTEIIAPRVLAAAQAPLVKAVKINCAKHTRTGAMMNSISASKPKENKYGWFTCVGPTGESTRYIDDSGSLRERKVPVRNAEILAYMEYGTKRQKKTPIITDAVKESREEVERLMQEEYDRIVQEMGYGR